MYKNLKRYKKQLEKEGKIEEAQKLYSLLNYNFNILIY